MKASAHGSRRPNKAASRRPLKNGSWLSCSWKRFIIPKLQPLRLVVPSPTLRRSTETRREYANSHWKALRPAWSSIPAPCCRDAAVLTTLTTLPPSCPLISLLMSQQNIEQALSPLTLQTDSPQTPVTLRITSGKTHIYWNRTTNDWKQETNMWTEPFTKSHQSHICVCFIYSSNTIKQGN